jgi:hypothetical protein
VTLEAFGQTAVTTTSTASAAGEKSTANDTNGSGGTVDGQVANQRGSDKEDRNQVGGHLLRSLRRHA